MGIDRLTTRLGGHLVSRTGARLPHRPILGPRGRLRLGLCAYLRACSPSYRFDWGAGTLTAQTETRSMNLLARLHVFLSLVESTVCCTMCRLSKLGVAFVTGETSRSGSDSR